MVIAVGEKIPSGISVKVVEVSKEANGVYVRHCAFYISFLMPYSQYKEANIATLRKYHFPHKYYISLERAYFIIVLNVFVSF